MSQYIGKTISLISNKGIRYLGILDNIDADNGTVSLTQVRSFGTEGRVHDVTKMVPPKNDIFGHVMFKGSDIQDLNILDCDINQVFPEPLPSVAAASPAVTPKAPEPVQAKSPAPEPVAEPVQAPKNEKENESPQRLESNGSNGARGAQGNPRTVYNAAPQRKAAAPVAIPDEDFDFETNNAKFVKEEEEEANAETYNKKSSFFDTLSSSTEGGQNDRMRWSEEKNLNYDTFGQTSLHRGRGRGRGRGGFRGRGRGGYRGRGNFRNGNREQSKPEWA